MPSKQASCCTDFIIMSDPMFDNPTPAPWTEFSVQFALRMRILFQPLDDNVPQHPQNMRHMINVHETGQMLPWRNASSATRSLYVPGSTDYQVPEEVTNRELYFSPRFIAVYYGKSYRARFASVVPDTYHSAAVGKGLLNQFFKKSITELDDARMERNVRRFFAEEEAGRILDVMRRIMLPARFDTTTQAERDTLQRMWAVVLNAPLHDLEIEEIGREEED